MSTNSYNRNSNEHGDTQDNRSLDDLALLSRGFPLGLLERERQDFMPLSLDEKQKKSGVVTYSSGNHAQGVAAADADQSISTPSGEPRSATQTEAETAVPQTAIAAAPAPATAAPPASAPRTVRPSPGIVISGSWRVRQEAWDWFRTDGFDDEYSFTGSLLRLSASRSRPLSPPSSA